MKTKLPIFIITIFFILISISIVSATTYKLLCLDQGQTIRFSKCNPTIPDRTCTSTSGCQYCVSVPSSNTYCPADLSICNIAGYACSAIDSGVIQQNQTQTNQSTGTTNTTQSSTLSLTGITTIPTIPIQNNKSQQTIKIYFQSNKYPVTIVIKLYNTDNTLMKTSSSMLISSQNQLPISYILPSQLNIGNHTLTITGISSQSTQTVTIGNINVQNFVTSTNSSQQINSIETNQQTDSTSSSSSSSNTTSQSSGSSSSTSSTSLEENSNQNKNIQNPIVSQRNNSINNTSKVTGAVIGSFSTIKMTGALIAVLLITVIYLWVKKKINKSKKNNTTEFKI
jgi:hypothetical protein